MLLMTLPYVIASVAKNPTGFATTLTPAAIAFGVSLSCAVCVIASELKDFEISPGWVKFFRRVEFASFVLGVVYLLCAFFAMSWSETKAGEMALSIFALAVLGVAIYCLWEYRCRRKSEAESQSRKPVGPSGCPSCGGALVQLSLLAGHVTVYECQGCRSWFDASLRAIAAPV